MPIVRCPKCNRALNFPEYADITTAQCPLCQTTFEVADRVERPAPPSRRVPEISRAQPQRVPQPAPFDFGPDDDGLKREDRAALRSAVVWLKTAALLSMGHVLLCGCCPFSMMRPGPSPSGIHSEDLAAAMCFGYFVHLGVGIVLYFGADALGRRVSYRWAMFTCVLGLVAAVIEAVFSLPALAFLGSLHARYHSQEEAWLMVGVILIYPAAMMLFFTGALKGLAALRRPGVREAFRA
jgi:hypothetical protein